MRRDPRLHGLSSEHHHALVLSRRIQRALEAGSRDPELLAAARASFTGELLPHFRTEEDLLLPALERAGQHDLVNRTRQDHAALRRLLKEATHHADFDALGEFARVLAEHVRFEERELFPVCERTLADDVLRRVADRNPKPS